MKYSMNKFLNQNNVVKAKIGEFLLVLIVYTEKKIMHIMHYAQTNSYFALLRTKKLN